MRTMKQCDIGSVKGSQLPIIKWLLLKNSWEVYVSEEKGDEIFCLTLGIEDELGYSSMQELKPFIVWEASGDELNDIAPAPNWEWVD